MRYESRLGEHVAHAADAMCELAKANNVEVLCDFNEIELKATPDSTGEAIVAYFNAECERRRQAYLASPEYAESQRLAAEKEAKRQSDLNACLSTAPEAMTVRDTEAWQKWRDANKDDYGGAVISYAERWARCMEAEIGRGKPLVECAKPTSHLADTEGITGFMYGCAVRVLADCWIHGEELRRWHNHSTQLGTEGDEANENGGVLNPAVISIG
jgi:hypothetical protein